MRMNPADRASELAQNTPKLKPLFPASSTPSPSPTPSRPIFSPPLHPPPSLHPRPAASATTRPFLDGCPRTSSDYDPSRCRGEGIGSSALLNGVSAPYIATGIPISEDKDSVMQSCLRRLDGEQTGYYNSSFCHTRALTPSQYT